MTISLKRKILETLFDMHLNSSGSTDSTDNLSKKIAELSEENEKLKKLYLKSQVDMISMQTIVRSIAQNQAQMAADMHTIYTSVRDAGIMDTEYGESDLRNTPDTDEDDESGSGGGGMGGMLN